MEVAKASSLLCYPSNEDRHQAWTVSHSVESERGAGGERMKPKVEVPLTIADISSGDRR